MKILAVDDDPATLALMEAGLMGAGHDVVKAAGGEEAWRLINEKHVSIVVSDWLMPGCDGLELCRRIRGGTFDSYTYVILITVDSGRNKFLRAMEAGIDDFISKPVDFGVLAARLRVAERVLSLQSELRDLRRVIPVCLKCFRVRGDGNEWQRVDAFLDHEGTGAVSHAYCPDCAETVQSLPQRSPSPSLAPAPRPSSGPPRERPRVLLVDDSEALLVLTQAVLEDAGFEVLTESSAPAAAGLIEESKPDIALLDLSLPEMTGDEIVRAVRQSQGIGDTRLYLYSGKDPTELAAIVTECGADGFIEKTASPEELVDRVTSLLSAAEPDAEAEPGRPPIVERRLHALRHSLLHVRALNSTPEMAKEAHTLAHQLHGAAATFGDAEAGEWAGKIEKAIGDVPGPGEEQAWAQINAALVACELEPIPVPIQADPDDASSGARILIVDDSRASADQIIAVLDDRYRVEAVTDPMEGLAKLERQPVDLVVTDVVMPHVSGLGFLSALRQRHPSIPVLVCSADMDLPTVSKATALGATAMLRKPVQAEEAAEVVRVALGQEARAKDLELSAAHLDGVKEIFNISAGAAAKALSRLLRHEVKLTGAGRFILRPGELRSRLVAGVLGEPAVVRNDFSGAAVGTAYLIMSTTSASNVVASLVAGSATSEAAEAPTLNPIQMETLTEVGNIMVGPVIGALANTLEIAIEAEEPTCEIGERISVGDLLRAADGEYVLQTETLFGVPDFHVHGKLGLLIGSSKLTELVGELDRMLA